MLVAIEAMPDPGPPPAKAGVWHCLQIAISAAVFGGIPARSGGDARPLRSERSQEKGPASSPALPNDVFRRQFLKLPSLRATVDPAAHDVNSRLPLEVDWLLSQVAVEPFHFTYLYCIAVLAGNATVPVHGTLAPEPWIVNA